MRFIAERGYDPVFGARPIKRAIQRHLVDPLASALLAGKFAAGDRIVADSAGDEITFSRAAAPGTEAA